MNNITYSIVTPVYNESETINEFLNRLSTVMQTLGKPYEIILVNDGSKDDSLEIMLNRRKEDKRIKIVDLTRNFGHQIAISAGIHFSKGHTVVIMDADLQDPPEIIPKLVEKLNEGYEVVYGVRRKRKENIFKRAAYFIFYRTLKKMSNIEIPLDSGDFSAMSRRVVNLLKYMPERNRFIRGLRSWVGFKQIGLEYERHKRYAGKAKYTFLKLLKLALDGMISFSYVPLRIASFIGFIISIMSFVGIIVVIYLKLFTTIPFKGVSALAIIILFLGGIQLLLIGILGEYIGRIYDETKQRPLYATRELYGFNENTENSIAGKPK